MLSFKAGNPNRSIIRGIISIAIGVTLIIVPGLTLNTVIQLIGGLLILDGFVNFLIRTFGKQKPQSAFVIIPKGIPNLILGIILLSFPAFMVGAFVFLIGFVLIVAGGSQLASQLLGRSVIGFSWLFFLIGLVAFISGLVMLTKPFESAVTLLAFFGAIVALYGVGEIFWSFKIRKYLKQQPKSEPATIDAEYEEVE